MSQASTNLTQTILQGVWQQASLQPERIAVRMGSVGYTYLELMERSERLGEKVKWSGLAQKRIGLYLSNHPDFLMAFYGCVIAGAIAVPLPADLLREQLNEYQEHLELTDIWDYSLLNEYVEKPVGSLRTVEVIPDAMGFPRADDLFYMAVSSGSTGKPKGILRNHRSWAISFDTMYEAFGIGSEDTILIPGPLHYSASLIAALQVLHQGGEVVLLPSFHAESVIETIRSGQITATFLVPTMMAKLLAALKEQPELSQSFATLSLKVVTAGAKLDSSLKEEWLAIFQQSQLYEYYGAAELSFVSYVGPDEQLTIGNSVGKPFPQIKFVILNEAGDPCEVGQIGQVYVQSEMVAQSYGHRGADQFLEPMDGYYTVGDLGYLNEAGYLFLTGRKQEMILRGGVNIYPLEVEQALLKHPEVKEAAVLGIADSVMGERIVAVLVMSTPMEPMAAGMKLVARNDSVLHGWVTQHLQPSRWPDFYWFTCQLPTGSAGKVDKATLRNWIALLQIRPGLATADFYVEVSEGQSKRFAEAVAWPMERGLPPTLPVTFWQQAYPEWLARCSVPQLLKEQRFRYTKPLQTGTTYRCRIECMEVYFVQTPKKKVYLSLLHRLTGESEGELAFEADTLLYLPVPEPMGTEVMTEPAYEPLAERRKPLALSKNLMTAENIRQYAHASGDTQAIHVSEEAAQKAGFPSIVAHGMYGMGLAISPEAVMAGKQLNLFWMRFVAPVFAGDQVQFDYDCKDHEAINDLCEQRIQVVGITSRTGKPAVVGLLIVTKEDTIKGSEACEC